MPDTTPQRRTATVGHSASDWFISAAERDNRHTDVDSRHVDGASFTSGNEVRALVHGAEYFRELCERVEAMKAGELVLFTDWRGDPDERLHGADTAVSTVLCRAAARGVTVKGLVWRSHWDRFAFSAQENEHLGDEIEAAGGECVRDMRVRVGGSHHQKMVILRHPSRPELDIAYVGGIDLCHSRRDDDSHEGDPQALAIAKEYGPTPPWHDVQLAVAGPAVGDIEASFRERWNDPSPVSRNPIGRLRDLLRHEDTHADPLTPQLPDPKPRGRHQVQVLRTYPYRHHPYPFAPSGERSIARAYGKALRNARSLIYVEDQYLWSEEIAALFAAALAERRELLLIGVVPMHPDQSGLSGAAQTLGRTRAIEALRQAGGDRVAIYSIENAAGTPIYVHAKVSIVDDLWTSVGSDNINLRSWTHDSELSIAVADDEPAGTFGQELRLRLNREHLGRVNHDDEDLREPVDVFAAYARAADQLEAWYASGRRGPRPSGRLRRYQPTRLPRVVGPLAAAMYRLIADPDGRPPALRRARRF